jgi:hypothetical protein
MTNKQLLKKYDKITDDICSIGDTGGTHHDTHYYNKQGALEDWCELEDAIREGNTVNGIQVQGITDGSCISIMNRLNKALIVAKTIDKMNKLEDILDENIQYG